MSATADNTNKATFEAARQFAADLKTLEKFKEGLAYAQAANRLDRTVVVSVHMYPDQAEALSKAIGRILGER